MLSEGGHFLCPSQNYWPEKIKFLANFEHFEVKILNLSFLPMGSMRIMRQRCLHTILDFWGVRKYPIYTLILYKDITGITYILWYIMILTVSSTDVKMQNNGKWTQQLRQINKLDVVFKCTVDSNLINLEYDDNVKLKSMNFMNFHWIKVRGCIFHFKPSIFNLKNLNFSFQNDANVNNQKVSNTQVSIAPIRIFLH